MAHSAILSSLVESLVTSLTGLSNEFEVKASYEGLVEKFSILNRDDLADALDIRLKKLADVSSKFTPEILSLFLHLSDRPVEKSRLKDLEALKPPPPPPPLTWADIYADDPLNEEGIWDDIDYAAESSEDEKNEEFLSDLERNPHSFILVPDVKELHGIDEVQFWKRPDLVDGYGTVKITELQAVREVLFMLRGLPTSLFRLDEDSGAITCNTSYALEHAIPATFHHLLTSSKGIGVRIYGLHQWARLRQSVLVLQTLQASTTARLREFDTDVAKIEQRFVAPERPVLVSLIQVHSEIEALAHPLKALAATLSAVDGSANRHTFKYLEALFDDTNIAQMAGDPGTFRFMADIFFECLQTYLKPVRKWMEEGELETDDQIFFVGVSDKGSEASSLWHERFVLRHGTDGNLHAPKFLHPAVRKVFNTGKSITFLKELGHNRMQDAFRTDVEPSLEFETVCSQNPAMLLTPFAELFNAAFENWIRSKHSAASLTLRQRLYEECGLWRSLDALEYIYFSRDGTLFQAFADELFERLEGRRRVWDDRFLLTELAQTTFSGIGCVNEDSIAIRVTSTKYPRRSIKTLSSISIEYMLPWSITNVIRRTSFKTYQRIFTFLLQVYRAKHLLRKLDFRSSHAVKVTKHTHLIYSLRYHMLWFTDILHAYLTSTVIDASTTTMRKRMAEAEDIDAMATVHEDYINRLRSQCLLSKNLAPIHQAIISLLDLCVLFTDAVAQPSARHAPAEAPTKRPTIGTNRRTSKRQATEPPDDESFSEDEDSDDGYEAEAEKGASVAEGPVGERLGKLREQFEKLCTFVAVGLRGVGRVGAEPAWEMLAERLEWGEGGMGDEGLGKGGVCD
ncbi:phosphoribosylformylglycinamidine synthase [Coniosporium tulheliwenetii]|uniref:Phosphoribosylformylglycinamidine synthase n=1 Tax=Coniosporium tulheliwenetii TaxID=3383036 RepID=A0ACC2YXF5_9PEZI|nr:phosphoribosylformylglycinamidine synthase [Cladosporium sp. JES 115]